MNPIDDNSPDPEDIQTVAHPEPELGRKFYWRGKELAAFSYNYRCALFRLTPGVSLTNFEHDFLFLYLLLQTPKKVDSLRSEDEISTFRLEVGKWVQKNKLDEKYDEIRALVKSIMDPVAEAESLVPALPPGEKAAPGNV